MGGTHCPVTKVVATTTNGPLRAVGRYAEDARDESAVGIDSTEEHEFLEVENHMTEFAPGAGIVERGCSQEVAR